MESNEMSLSIPKKIDKMVLSSKSFCSKLSCQNAKYSININQQFYAFWGAVIAPLVATPNMKDVAVDFHFEEALTLER